MVQQVPMVIKLKTAFKMTIQRLRYAQEKQQSLAKKSKREVAQLLLKGSEQKAKYRVETLINDDVHIELLEVLELYCELLYARVSILSKIKDEADLIEHHSEDGINEAVRSLIYAQAHVPEIKELLKIKELLSLKFGVDWLKAILNDKLGVSENVSIKCSFFMPDAGIVSLYLREIALTYEVPYSELKSTKYPVSIDSDTNDIARSFGNNCDDEKLILASENDQIADKMHLNTIKFSRKQNDTIFNDLNISESIAKDVKTHKKENEFEDSQIEDLKRRFEALRK